MSEGRVGSEFSPGDQSHGADETREPGHRAAEESPLSFPPWFIRNHWEAGGEVINQGGHCFSISQLLFLPALFIFCGDQDHTTH